MRIGIDGSQLLHHDRSGLYWYVHNLLRGLSRSSHRHQVAIYATGNVQQGQLRQLRQTYRMPVKQYQHPRFAYRLRVGLHSASRVSLFQYMTTTNFPLVRERVNAFLIPDLTTLHFPDWHTEANRRLWETILEQAVNSADLVLTFSQHTCDDVAAHLNIPRERMAGVALAASEKFRPIDERVVAQTLAKHGLKPRGFLLSVGTLDPRKNHITLLRAYRKLLDTERGQVQPLVLCGSKGWGYDKVAEEMGRLGLGEQVRLLGHFDPLEVLYSGASMMIYPSVYEGFGLPPLEAMACGTPVISSNAASLPEVVGDASLLVDPHDVDGLTEAMRRLLKDESLAEDLTRKGLQRAKSFTWQRTAENTLAAYEQAVARK